MGPDVDRTQRLSDPFPAPMSDVRRTPLGQIPVDRADAVARIDDRRATHPTRVEVASFGSTV
ncbi:hypothetical protein GA0070216_12755 [Micromonospora matsumotoense]|uniref:FXSXX-COOH protein n=1 Tax=Micromonospora matsumotoense TaxID=121616 RepID=A0A1C5ATM5_9ACTN|nr:hypothetical protein GA0070216_12755 [Micromonospora matsumotoense]